MIFCNTPLVSPCKNQHVAARQPPLPLLCVISAHRAHLLQEMCLTVSSRLSVGTGSHLRNVGILYLQEEISPSQGHVCLQCQGQLLSGVLAPGELRSQVLQIVILRARSLSGFFATGAGMANDKGPEGTNGTPFSPILPHWGSNTTLLRLPSPQTPPNLSCMVPPVTPEWPPYTLVPSCSHHKPHGTRLIASPSPDGLFPSVTPTFPSTHPAPSPSAKGKTEPPTCSRCFWHPSWERKRRAPQTSSHKVGCCSRGLGKRGAGKCPV